MTVERILRSLLCAIGALLIGCSTSGGREPVSRVVVFGDSLSDGGAAHALAERWLSEGLPGTFQFPAPAAAYPLGWWSNGPTTVMHFAQMLGAPIDNQALGGATSGHLLYDTGPGTPPMYDRYLPDGGGVLGQVARYVRALQQAGAAPDRQAVVVLWASWNDYFRWADYKSPGTYVAVADQAVANLREAVQVLVSAGFRRLLLVNSPSSPVLAGLQDNVQFDAFKQRFNAGLAALAVEPAWAAGEVEVTLFDAYAADRGIFANARALGLSDTTTPCEYVFSVKSPTPRCDDPDAHYYWDEVHPTTRAHRLLAERMVELYR